MFTIFFSIQLMKFYLHTAYEDLATFYGGGLSLHPFQGVCQGNGSGLAIWLVLSLCLIHMIHQSGSPYQISSAVSLTSIAMVCCIYNNDGDLFVLPPSDLTPQGVLQTLQHNLDIWQGGMEATSGVLSLDKCSWSGLFYYFKAGQWKLHASQSYPAILAIHDHGPQLLPLKCYEPDEAGKVVGIHQSLSGSIKVLRYQIYVGPISVNDSEIYHRAK